jgi:hypothetical protein
MTQPRLVACSSCARHVRVSETTCPFCSKEIGEAARSGTARKPPTERLSRAALVAFGGGLAVAAACGGSVGQGTGGEHDSGTVDSETHDAPFGVDAIGVLYGVPVDAGFAPDAGDGPDGTFAPPYGISPPFDAGEPSDATSDDSSASDANRQDVGIAVPYGVPVPGDE